MHYRTKYHTSKAILKTHAWLLILGINLCLGVSSFSQSKKEALKLVQTYSTETDLRTAHPTLKKLTPDRIKVGKTIVEFLDSETGQKLATLKKKKDESYRNAEKDVIIRTNIFGYGVSEDGNFLIEAHYNLESFGGADHDITNDQLVAVKLYDKSGKFVVELPKDAGNVLKSPTNSTFVSYGNGLEPSQYIYFHEEDGQVNSKYKINAFPVVKYTRNGKFVAVHNIFGNIFYIFSKDGALLLQMNYQEVAGIEHPLGNIFVAEDGKTVLICTKEAAYLATIDGVVINKINNVSIADAILGNSAKSILLTKAKKGPKFSLQSIDLATGKVLSETSLLDWVEFTSKKVIAKQSDKYLEFEIQ